MTDQLVRSASDYTIFPKTLTFNAEPETALDIIDRWRDGDTTYVRVRHPQTRATERYAVAQVFALVNGERYLVLSTLNVPSEDLTLIVFELAGPDQLKTLTPEKFQQLSSQLEIFEVNDDFHKLSNYIGQIDDRTERIPYFQNYLKKALTNEVSFDTEMISPGTTIVIEKKWQHFGTIFMELRQSNREMTHTFRLVWLINIARDAYAVLAYPQDITAESDVVPRIITRLIDQNTMVVLADAELDYNRNRFIDTIAGRDDIKPEEASQYIGFIASP